MAWLFLNESLSSYDIIGFLIASFGVFIATGKISSFYFLLAIENNSTKLQNLCFIFN